jgi:hypothetical protein
MVERRFIAFSILACLSLLGVGICHLLISSTKTARRFLLIPRGYLEAAVKPRRDRVIPSTDHRAQLEDRQILSLLIRP